MQKATDYDWLVKVIIIGDSGVGKSNILGRFCDDKFSATHMATVGVDFKIKTINVEGRKIKLQLWDTAGQERFRNITRTYYKGASGVILAYSVIERQTFENVESWIRSLKENASENIPIIIVANKCDFTQERQVTMSEGKQLADQYNCPFLEVSAKENINISEIFNKLGSIILKKLLEDDQQNKANPAKVNQGQQITSGNTKNQEKKEKCC